MPLNVLAEQTSTNVCAHKLHTLRQFANRLTPLLEDVTLDIEQAD